MTALNLVTNTPTPRDSAYASLTPRFPVDLLEGSLSEDRQLYRCDSRQRTCSCQVRLQII